MQCLLEEGWVAQEEGVFFSVLVRAVPFDTGSWRTKHSRGRRQVGGRRETKSTRWDTLKFHPGGESVKLPVRSPLSTGPGAPLQTSPCPTPTSTPTNSPAMKPEAWEGSDAYSPPGLYPTPSGSTPSCSCSLAIHPFPCPVPLQPLHPILLASSAQGFPMPQQHPPPVVTSP